LTLPTATATVYREATLAEIMTGARQALSIRVRKGIVFNSPKVTADYLGARLGQLQHQVFTLIYVDYSDQLLERYT
jgi:DNA repair protein RadC